MATWTIAPPLPAGLAFNSTTGAITGTPANAFAPTNVTVTAANAGGSSKTTLTLGADSVLLNYGARCLQASTATFPGLAVSSGSVLTEDCGGFTQHWVLWNYSSGAILAQGDACPVATCIGEGVGGPVNVELAVQIAVVPYIAAVGEGLPPYSNIAMGFQVLSATDGSVVATVTPSGGVLWWRVAPDGSYICGAAGPNRNLTVWAPDGSVITTRPGNYTNAVAYCSPGQVRVALRPAGTNVIESITVPGGASSVSPAFAGTFSSWSGDGGGFLSNVGTTVWVYSPAAMQQDFTTLPTSAGLAGWGPWFWTFDGTTLTVYKVGASAAPAATYTVSGANQTTVASSGPTIAIFDTQLRIIDLSGGAPSETDYSPPISGVAYAAASASQWVLGSYDGALLDGASLGGTPRYFGCGTLRSLAGSQSRLAVATSIGKVLIFRTSDFTLETTLDFSAAQLSISADGSMLALRASGSPNLSGVNDGSVRTVSLPSGTIINTWPYTTDSSLYAVDITLSSSGALLGQVLNSPMRQVTSSSGGAVLWSDSVSTEPIRLSLDDTLIAVSSAGLIDVNPITTIYRNFLKSSAVPGWGVGWLQGNYVLQDVSSPTASGEVFSSAGI